MDEEQTSSKKIWIILGGIILLLLIGVIVFLLIHKKGTDASGDKSIGSLFGSSGADTGRPSPTGINPGTQVGDGTAGQNNDQGEPLFRQLANIPVAGATAVMHDGKTYVRYVSRENGNIFEVDPLSGVTTQLTNTTIPRIYEAEWGNSGNSVVLRYLVHDQLSRQDTIKTYLANLILPITQASSTSGQSSVGTLKGDFLPDNISALSVSPDGAHLFYLLPIQEGVSGSIVSIATLGTREVLRSTFSEWLPELLNSGLVVLTTKPSANVPGFSYLYNPLNKTFSRLVREKNGLTTHSEASGNRMVYSENISGNTVLDLYDAKGFLSDDGETVHTQPLQLSTLPEKCVWSGNHIRLFCAAFSAPPKAEIPDDWYQGALSFSDTFWTINTDTSEITFLVDPSKEKSALRSFDVFSPFVGGDEKHFFFIDKNDATLWSMHLIKEKFTTAEEATAVADTPVLTAAEQKDALGSTATTTSKTTIAPPPTTKKR